FLPTLKTYIPELARKVKAGPPSAPPPATIASKMAEIRESIDAVSHVPVLALYALARMEDPRSVKPEAKRFQQDGAEYVSEDPAARLRLVETIARQLQELDALLRTATQSDDTTKEARDLVASTPSLLDQVHGVEKLVLDVRSASDEWSQSAGTLSPAHSR